MLKLELNNLNRHKRNNSAMNGINLKKNENL